MKNSRKHASKAVLLLIAAVILTSSLTACNRIGIYTNPVGSTINYIVESITYRITSITNRIFYRPLFNVSDDEPAGASGFAAASSTSSSASSSSSSKAASSSSKASTSSSTSSSTGRGVKNSITISDSKSNIEADNSDSTLSADAVKRLQIEAINSMRGNNGQNTLAENAQLEIIAAQAVSTYASYGKGEISETKMKNSFSDLIKESEASMQIDGAAVKLSIVIEPLLPTSFSSWDYSGDESEITSNADYIGNSVIKTSSGYYCIAVLGSVIKNVIWTGETLDDGTIRLTGYDKNGPVPTGAVTLPSELSGKQVTEIDSTAFSDCNTITSVTVPGSIQVIKWSAFADCENLNEVIVEQGVKVIETHAFVNCASLESVTLPSSITKFSSNTADSATGYIFSGCTSLKKFNYPSTDTIYRKDFEDCTSLKEIYIPKSVTCIKLQAFENCFGLTDVYYAGSPAEWAAVDIEDYNGYLLNATIHYYSTAL